MLSKPSSIRCVIIICVFLVLSFILINQNVIEVQSFANSSTQLASSPLATTVPLDQLLNLPIKFKFLIKPNVACDDKKQLIVLVHSKIDHFIARDEIRSTWGSLQDALNYRLIFLIGLQAKANETIEALLKEEKVNDDLVRGNFIDTYRNLTYKHAMGYKFVLHYCSKIHFIMKSDDDAFINIFEIINLLNLNNKLNLNHSYAEIKLLNSIKNDKESIENNQIDFRRLIKQFKNDENFKFIACSLFANGTLTKRTGKWSLTKEEYNLDYYPAYCSGMRKMIIHLEIIMFFKTKPFFGNLQVLLIS